jgi:hypothetical protein
MLDGTYCLEDVHAMHQVLDDITEQAEKARSAKT